MAKLTLQQTLDKSLKTAKQYIDTELAKKADSSHTHNYAGSSSAGGAANSVKTNLTIKLNGGTTEGTNLFTFNGSTAKTIDITPSSIGAAASSHGTHLTLGTGSGNAFRGDHGVIAYNHSQAAHAPSNAQKNSDITKAEIEAKLTGAITSHTHSSYAHIDNGLKYWGCSIKCATWSRLFYFKSDNTTTGGSFIFNVRGTRSSVVYDATFMVNFSHSQKCKIVQLNNSEYSNIQVRGITKDGEGYIEIYDNVNGATNTTTQNVSVSFIRLSNMSLTMYTAFTNGSTVPSGFAENAKLTTVSGSYYSGTAANASKVNNTLSIQLNSGTATTFNGSAAKSINITPASIGAAASSHGTHLTIGTGAGNAAAGNHTHNAIVSRGNVTCESGITARPAVAGLSMSQAYNNGYPTPYGNIINLRGTGDGQILVGWSGTDGAHAPVYVRSKRDNTSTANWSGWAQIYTSANPQTTMNGLSLWKGTQAQYDAISSKSSTTLYFITG